MWVCMYVSKNYLSSLNFLPKIQTQKPFFILLSGRTSGQRSTLWRLTPKYTSTCFVRHERNLTMPGKKRWYNFFPLKIQLGCNESFCCQKGGEKDKRKRVKKKKEENKKENKKEKEEKEAIQHHSLLKELGILTIHWLYCFHQTKLIYISTMKGREW